MVVDAPLRVAAGGHHEGGDLQGDGLGERGPRGLCGDARAGRAADLPGVDEGPGLANRLDDVELVASRERRVDRAEGARLSEIRAEVAARRSVE